MKRIISVVLLCLFVTFFNVVLAETEDEMVKDFSISINGKNVPAKIKSVEVITATRTKTLPNLIANSITVITGEEIKKSHKNDLVDILKDVQGIDIVQTGTAGADASVFIRGANSEYTMIMIDGVEMNDPMSPGRSYNFANMTLENVERIEIIRGSQSTLYGSDAMGGVINIITKKGASKRFSLFSEAGSFRTFREGIEIGGGNNKFSYSLGISRIDSEGISSAGGKYGNIEKDGYQNTSLSSRFTFTPKEKISADLLAKYLISKTDLDYSSGLNGDDPNYIGENKELYLGLQCGLPSFIKEGEQKIGVSFSRHNRDYRNDTDKDRPLVIRSGTYSSQIRKINWQNSLEINKINNLLVGLEYEEERGSSYDYSESAWGVSTADFPEKKAQNRSYYIQDQINVRDNFFAAIGARLDNYDRFGSKITYRIAPGYNITSTNTKLKASYATGFKSPSLFQFYSTYGNLDLNPEKNRGWDAGLEQYFFDKLIFIDAVYFYNNYSNMIEWVLTDPITFDGEYQNISEAQTEGGELNASIKIKDDLQFKASAARLRTKNINSGENLIRRPKYKYSLGMAYQFINDGNISIDAVYTGKRDDKDFTTSQRLVLDSYTLVNASISYNINKTIEVYAKGNNIFNKDYEEAKGYGTPGSSFYGGIKINY